MASSGATAEPKGRRGSFPHDIPNLSLRMVVVGRTGAGKSSSGNTILDRKAFRAAKSSSSVTKECWKETGEVAGREVTVVDTPGLFDTKASELNLQQEISKCINMTAPGPHAFILVINLGPFTDEEKLSVEKIRAVFGEAADKHTMILFTHGDQLDCTIEEYVDVASENLKEIIRRCGGRYHVFNNKDIEDRTQVVDFLEKVDEMVTANEGKHFTNQYYEDVELKLKSKEDELRREYEQKLQDKERKLEARFTEEKRILEEKIQAASEQEKEKMKKDLQRLSQRITIELKEYRRFYEAKLREAREEAELSRINEEKLRQIITRLKTIHM